MRFCSYVIFLLRDQWMIARLSEAMGAALVGNNFSPIPMEISFPMKKKLFVTARYLQSIKTFSTVKPSQYRKSGACRGPQRLPQTRKRPVFVLVRPTSPSCAQTPAQCAGARPQELGHWFCSQILRLSSRIVFGSHCQTTCTVRQGLKFGLKLELCRVTNGL